LLYGRQRRYGSIPVSFGIQGTAREFARYVRLHTGVRAPRMHTSRDGGLVVSMSTIPSRIDFILPAIRSLFDQTLRPSRVILALPPHSSRENRPYRIPDSLRALEGLTIIDAERDWGPATKLLAALRLYRNVPNQRLVFVDDDNIYPRTLLETMARHAEQRPDAAIAMRGWQVPSSLHFKDVDVVFGSAIGSPLRVDVVTGCGGVLVRPRFFEDDVFALEERSDAFYVDDVWLSGHLARRGVQAFVVPLNGERVYWNALTTWVGHALDREENRDGVHDDAVLRQFADHWPSRRQ
jgi:hypothetical protein